MPLPIDTTSVKIAAATSIKPDLNDVGIRARNSWDSTSVVSGFADGEGVRLLLS